MTRMSRLTAAGVAAVLLVGLASSSATATPSATATLTALTVNGSTVLNGDAGHAISLTVHRGLSVLAAPGSTAQLIEVKDQNGAPIFSIPPFGGPAVYCDNLRLTASDIFNANVTLWWNGSITLNQQHGGVTIYSTVDDPNITSPLTDTSCTAPAAPRGFRPGDRDLQSGCSSTVPTQCYGTWVWDGAVWVNKG